MSTAKLKQTVDVMTPAERAFVGAYLQHLARADDPLHKAKLGQRMRRMDSGRRVSLAQARGQHTRQGLHHAPRLRRRAVIAVA